jgi:hypothetical protein
MRRKTKGGPPLVTTGTRQVAVEPDSPVSYESRQVWKFVRSLSPVGLAQLAASISICCTFFGVSSKASDSTLK